MCMWCGKMKLGNGDILYKRSTDGGISFVEPTDNLSENDESSELQL